jgi:hypothetical protein
MNFETFVESEYNVHPITGEKILIIKNGYASFFTNQELTFDGYNFITSKEIIEENKRYFTYQGL